MTAGMAGGTICAGIFGEVYNIKDYHSWHGVALTYVLAVVVICFIPILLKDWYILKLFSPSNYL